MSIDNFGLQDFFDALQPYKSDGPKFVQGEYVWYVVAQKGNKIIIRSSIALDGKANPAGKDSIRCWLADENGNPLAPKLQKYVTRVAGWQGRMQEKIDRLFDLSGKLGNCPKCGAVLRIIKSTTAKNPGRLFKKCSAGCKDWIGWFDELEREPEESADASVQTTKPTAPKVIQNLMADKDPEEDKRRPVPEPVHIEPKPRTVKIIGGSVLPTEIGVSYVNFTPSSFQEAVFRAVADGDDNIVIQAYAGTGKTKTLTQMHAGYFDVYARRHEIASLSVLSMAFNVKIAKTLKQVMPPNVTSSTIHSRCWAAVKQTFNLPPSKKPNPKKTWDHFKRMTQYGFNGELEDNGAVIVRLVSLLRTHVMEPIPSNLDYLVNRFNLVLDGDKEAIYAFVGQLFHAVVNDFADVDFDDMTYWVAIGVAKPEQQFDVVTDDEAQDANPAQRLSILNMVKPGGRVIVVGDKFQSLYAFSGADPTSMAKFTDALSAKVLPLSICYRCPTSVLDLVRQEFPYIPIENSPWAKEGSVNHLPYKKLVETGQSGDLVLCRTNAPNAKLCLEFIKEGKKAYIEGRDVGANLVSKIRKIDKKYKCDGNLEVFLSALQNYTEAEVGKLIAAKRETAAGLVSDEADTILALSDGSDTVQQLISRTTSIFSEDETEGIRISTVHKIKGEQALRVFIIHPELMPHPMAKTEDDLQQERNVKYVATTRAQESLTFVEGK